MTSPQPSDTPQLPPATTRSAVPLILRRAVGLLLALAAGWLIVDRALAAWVQHEEAIVRQMARYVPRQDPDRLQSLLTVGEQDAPMSVVLACDLALPRCRRQLATLVAWQAQPSKALRTDVDKGAGKRRLVYLPWPMNASGTLLAQTAHALDAQGLLWGAVPMLAQDPATWSAATLDRALHAIDADPRRLARVRDDPETVLAVQVERTMAEALEIPRDSGLLVAGLPLAATQSEGAALLAALETAEGTLAENLRFFGGDVPLAQARGLAGLPARTRERFVRWILVGKKVASLPGTAGANGLDPDDGDEDEPDEAP